MTLASTLHKKIGRTINYNDCCSISNVEYRRQRLRKISFSVKFDIQLTLSEDCCKCFIVKKKRETYEENREINEK